MAPTPKKPNPPDATFRNITALKKRVDVLEARLKLGGFVELPKATTKDAEDDDAE
jgi:hypothetical protein